MSEHEPSVGSTPSLGPAPLPPGTGIDHPDGTAVLVMGVLSLLAVVTIRQQGAADGNAESLLPVSSALVAVRADEPGDLRLHQRLGQHPNPFPQHVPVLLLAVGPLWRPAKR